MSADHSTKYSVGTMNILPDGTALTDHARHRYRERTPHDCDISITQAYSWAEAIPHPILVQTANEDRIPERALVYHHRDNEWNIIFIINSARGAHRDVDEVVCTCVRVEGYDHGPTRAYLNSFGPHFPGGGDQ
jgi:hypothetical protein